jgi:uncharacterized RDD family membrane protein YckC
MTGIVLGLVTAYFAFKPTIKNSKELGFVYAKTPEEKEKANLYREKHKTSPKWFFLYSAIGGLIYTLVSNSLPSLADILKPFIIGWMISFVPAISIAGKLSDKKVRSEFLNDPKNHFAPTFTSSTTSIRYASVWRRMIAILIDVIINVIPSFVIAFVLAVVLTIFMGTSWWQNSHTVETALSFVIILYLIFFLLLMIASSMFIYKKGQTPGKMVMKIKVVKEDGSQITFKTAFIRETIGKLPFLVFFYWGFLSMSWDPKNQTWHDKLCGTIVINI